MKGLRHHLANAKKETFALLAPQGITVEETRKIMEYVLRNTRMKVNIYGPNGRKKRTPPEEGGTILIKAGEKSFAEALKEVKEGLKETEATLKGARKTRSGDILLTVKGGRKGADKIEEAIRTKTSMAAQIKQRGRRTLHIQGLDCITTKEEVEDALKTQLGQDNLKECQVLSMRPVQGERQSVTVSASREIADRLTATGRIKIGWLECLVRERMEIARCFRCQEFGHTRASCKGPDRSGICHKCGKPGHVAKDCQEKGDFCHACQVEGHRSSSSRCPILKRMISEARARTKTRTGGRAGAKQPGPVI